MKTNQFEMDIYHNIQRTSNSPSDPRSNYITWVNFNENKWWEKWKLIPKLKERKNWKMSVERMFSEIILCFPRFFFLNDVFIHKTWLRLHDQNIDVQRTGYILCLKVVISKKKKKNEKNYNRKTKTSKIFLFHNLDDLTLING